MKFRSTRDRKEQTELSFVDAVFEGLAPDGGLYYPLENYDLRKILQNMPDSISFIELATELTQLLFHDEFTKSESRELCTAAFPFSPKIRELDKELLLLELFYGPSCAFKDFGASYLAEIMSRELEKQGRKIVILVATSGDTGSAVAQAFYKKKNIEVAILYPSQRVSRLQELQLCALKENIHAFEVRGSFDDCQRIAKEAFLDVEFSQSYSLSSANSINIGRLIPQTFYYFYAWKRLQNFHDWLFCTPSGNFGNLTAGLLAMCWGMPVQHFIAATNKNKIVPEYLETGVFHPRASLPSPANAMDVGNPSNFERMLQLFKHSVKAMSDVLYGAWADDEEIYRELRAVYEKTGIYICPHTAAGCSGARQVLQALRNSTRYRRAVVLATADPGKFLDTIEKATNSRPELPERLSKFLTIEKKSYKIEPDLSSLQSAFSAIL